MVKTKRKESIVVSMRRSGDALYVSNGKGNEWKFPESMSERVAIASLVYGTMMGHKDEMDYYCGHYRVTLKIEVFEKEDSI